jgi:autotransporter translocation and assembly factor TamB
LRGNRPIELDLGIDGIDLQGLVDAASPNAASVSGVLAAHGTIGGTLSRPLGALAVTGADMVAFGEVLGSLVADVALAGRDVTLSRLVIEKPQPDGPGRISATGSYNLARKTYRFDLQSDNVELLAMKLPGGHRLGGRIELSAKGAGSLASPAGSASLSIDSRPVDGSPALGRIAIAATAANHEAIVNASAERFNVEARAVIGLARPWPTTLKARANDLPLDTLPVNVAARPDGRLRATLNATANLTELSRAEIEQLRAQHRSHAPP